MGAGGCARADLYFRELPSSLSNTYEMLSPLLKFIGKQNPLFFLLLLTPKLVGYFATIYRQAKIFERTNN